jgi:hypothetical protein
MSILLHIPTPVKRLVAKSKHVEPSVSSIFLIALVLFIAFGALIGIGVLFQNTISQYNICRDRIAGFEQSGVYTNSEQFKLALSYCGTS